MASPDFGKYIDLTLYDIEPYTIYSDAVKYAKDALPEFEPRRGTLEDALLQASAYSTSLMVGAINRLPNGLMEGLLSLMGFKRLEATFATGTAKFTVWDNTGVVIQSGTVVNYEEIISNSVVSWAFETVSDLLIPEGETEGTVEIRALSASKYPLLLDGQVLSLVSPAPSVLTVKLASNLSIGRDSETDSEYFTRGAQYLSSLNTTLTTSFQLSNYIKSKYPEITYFKVYDLTSASSSMYFGDDMLGHVTISMCDVNGDPISSTIWNTLYSDIIGKSVAGLTIEKHDMTTNGLPVTCSISVGAGYTPSSVSAAVATAINSFLSLSGFTFDQKIIANQLIALASAVPGVSYVDSLAIGTYEGDGVMVDGNLVLSRKGDVPIGVAEVSVV